MGFSVKEVVTPSEIKKFIKFPHKLYKSSEQYVPVLDSDEYKVLTASPSLEYCKLKMWVAVSDNGEIVGRIAGIYNPRSNDFHNEKRVRFGWFDFVNDKDVAQALLDKVAEWGSEMGMEQMHGPLGYNTWNRQGMLTDGFENTPPVNCLYNYSYYPEIMEQLGMEKQIDWVQVKLKADVGVPDKIRRINQMLLDKYKLKILDIKKMKDYSKFVDSFFRSYNESFKEIDNFVPLTRSEVEQIAREYFPKLREELTCIIVDKDENIAAFGICFPNLSSSFKKAGGKLFPFGLLHIMREFRKYDTIDLMILGAAPEWQNKGISSIYHTHIATNLERGRIKYAITNPQAENNSAYKVWDRYGYEPYMRRRCYIKNI
jgi:GNAT superfamily N-acetyltransferase